MSALSIFLIVVFYMIVLYGISWFTSRKADNNTFFIGNRKSPWYLVAFGMIGASLSGVTFISVPGWVGTSQFSYMQMVLGYMAGYFVIANVLMPLYYKLQLTSIYTYLEKRFGSNTYTTGASFFLLSRTIGSAFRLFLSAGVLQIILFQQIGVPFWLTVCLIVLFIYLFTFRGGIKTVVWTDTLQTAFLLGALVSCVLVLSHKLGLGFFDTFQTIKNSEYSRIFFFDDWNDKKHFIKQFLGGAFIAITMTGLDQDLMQKNLSCKNLGEAKKNMLWFSLILIPVNLLFLSLGAMLYIFSIKMGIALPQNSDDLFPLIATQSFMPAFFIVIFVLGLISCTYSSADSALTALTTSFTIDILRADKKSEKTLTLTRQWVHVAMALLLVGLILIFKLVNNQSIISTLFTAAGYTYGPLLGLYAFGLFTKWQVKDKWVPLVAILSPIATYFLNTYSADLFNGYKLGFELILINGMLTFAGLLAIRNSSKSTQ